MATNLRSEIVKLFKTTKRLTEIDEEFEKRILTTDSIVTFEPTKTQFVIPKNVTILLPMMYINWTDERVTNNKITIVLLNKEYCISFKSIDNKAKFLYLMHQLRDSVDFPMTNFMVDGPYKVTKTSYGYHMKLTEDVKFDEQDLIDLIKANFDGPVLYSLSLEDIKCVDNVRVPKIIQMFARKFDID